MEYIRKNLEKIRSQVGNTIIIAVSKSTDSDSVRFAYNLGQNDFGENRVQELLSKKEALLDCENIKWHLIGHLQTNKVDKIVSFIHMIHSVDSVHLAEKISLCAEKYNRKIPVLIQINGSFEESKYGIDPDTMEDFFNNIKNLPFIEVKGIMTMGPLTDNEDKIKECFKKTQDLFLYMKNKYPDNFCFLSMGMTDDYLLAVPFGATHLRIGRGIFSSGESL